MRTLLASIAMLFATAALAEDTGVLNPEELSVGKILDNAARGHVDMMTCAAGYPLVKAGRHEQARRILKLCAESGYTGAMAWMSYLDSNGAGAPEDPEAAAEWDRKAAMDGDPIGMFNYGLDKLRGYGTARDLDGGRDWIDRAAEEGLPMAETLRDSGYDTGTVTPDADDWKYGERAF
jgi:TPR repeat protein